jgi:hypothetical protein
MVKITFTFFIILLLLINTNAQVINTHIYRYDTPHNENGVTILNLADNNLVFSANISISPNKQNVIVCKSDPSLNIVWYKEFTRGFSQLINTHEDKNGNIIVTGFSKNEGSEYNDIFIIKYDSDGRENWKKIMQGSSGSDFTPVSSCLDKNDDILITSYFNTDENNINISTMKISNATGEMNWSRNYDNLLKTIDYPVKIISDNDNNIIVAAYNTNINQNNDILILKYRTNGDLVFSKSYNISKSKNDHPADLCTDDGNNLYLTGTSGNNIITLKLSSSGELLWVTINDNNHGGIDYSGSVTLDKYRNVIITGKISTTNSGYDIVTIKYNNEGVELWSSKFNGSANGNDEPVKVKADELGSIYVYGKTWNGSSNDIIILKYNSLGENSWRVDYNGSGNQNDQPNDIIIGEKGDIYIIGTSIGNNTSNDVVVAKYKQTPPENQPQLISPAFGSSGISKTPKFEWTLVNNSDVTELQIAFDKDFNRIVFDTIISISHDYTKINSDNILTDNTQYYWRARAVNTAGSGPWSQVWTFSVLLSPDSPQPLAPPNSAAGIPLSTALSWRISPTAESYRLQIARDIAFNEIIIDVDNITTNEYVLQNGLLDNNSQYFWRVSARNIAGIVPWSEVWTFGTGSVQIPKQPVLISIANESTGQSLTPLLEWQPIANASYYTIIIASDLNFTKVVLEQSGLIHPRFKVPENVLSHGTTYFWKVNAHNIGGTGPWSHIWTFTTHYSGLQKVGNKIPKELILYGNSPEPFSKLTTIRFDIPAELNNTRVTLSVYDKSGNEISKLVDKDLSAGSYEILWDGSNFQRGVYFYQLKTRGKSMNKKMFMVK